MLYHTPVMLSSGSEPQLPFSQVTTSSCGQYRVKQRIFLLMYGQKGSCKRYISEKYPQLFEMCKGNLDLLPPQDKKTNHTGHRRELKYLSTNFTLDEHNVRSRADDQERILETSLVGDNPGSGDFWKPGLGAKGLAGPGRSRVPSAGACVLSPQMRVPTAARRAVPGGLAPGPRPPEGPSSPATLAATRCSGRGGPRGHLQPLAPQLSPHKDRTNLRASEHRISGATAGSSPRILGGSTGDRQAGAPGVPPLRPRAAPKPQPLPLGPSRCHNSQAAEGKQLGDKLRVLNARRKHPRPTRFIFKEIHKRSLGQMQSSQQPHQLSKECHFLAGAGISGYFGAPMKRNPLKSTGFIFKEIHKRSLGQMQSSQQPHQLSKECHFLAGAGISGYFGAPMKRNPLKSTGRPAATDHIWGLRTQAPAEGSRDLPGPASPLAPRPGFQKSPDPGLSPTKDVSRILSWSSALDLTYIPELHQNPKISPEHKPLADPGSYGAGALVRSQKGPNCFLATSSHPKVTARINLIQAPVIRSCQGERRPGSASSRLPRHSGLWHRPLGASVTLRLEVFFGRRAREDRADGSARQLWSPETALTRRLMGMSDHRPRSLSPAEGPCTPRDARAPGPRGRRRPLSCPVPSLLGSRGSALLPGIAPETRCFHPNACSVFGFWWDMPGARRRALPGRSPRRSHRGPRRRGGGAGRAPGVSPGEEGARVGPRGCPPERRGRGSGPGGVPRRGGGAGRAPGVSPGEEGARVGPRGCPPERRGRGSGPGGPPERRGRGSARPAGAVAPVSGPRCSSEATGQRQRGPGPEVTLCLGQW
nr:collagen alpha-1(I) chain-like [Vulpes vulpes]